MIFMVEQTEKETNSARVWLPKLEAIAAAAEAWNCEKHLAYTLLEGAIFFDHPTRGTWINSDDLQVFINVVAKIIHCDSKPILKKDNPVASNPLEETQPPPILADNGIVRQAYIHPKGYLTGKEAGLILNLFPGEVKKLVIQKKLPGMTHGRGCYIKPEDVEAFKKKQQDAGIILEEISQPVTPAESNSLPEEVLLPQKPDLGTPKVPSNFESEQSVQQPDSLDEPPDKEKKQDKGNALLAGSGTTFQLFVCKTIKVGNGNGEKQPEEVCELKDILKSAPYLGSKMKIHIEQGRIRAVQQLKHPLDSRSELVTYVVVNDFVNFVEKHLPGAKFIVERKPDLH